MIICRCLNPMLTAIDLDNQPLSMAGEVYDISIYLNLAAEVRSFDAEAMTQVPPQSPLCISLRTSHLPRELALRQDIRPVIFR